jgi:phage terminase small subunit
MANGKLTPKQALFVREYLIDLNATQAAIRAGYSDKTARSSGQRMLTNVDIQEAIQKGQLNRAKRVRRTADDVLTDILRIGRKAEEAGEFSPALKAAELEGKHLGMFTDKLDHSGEVVIRVKRDRVKYPDASPGADEDLSGTKDL